MRPRKLPQVPMPLGVAPTFPATPIPATREDLSHMAREIPEATPTKAREVAGQERLF